MEIQFSRHAKRRAKLYRIPESIIANIITSMHLSLGEHEIVRDVVGLEYPLKIIVSVEEDTTTVISNYPVKKGRKK